jgi:hypothetical protein
VAKTVAPTDALQRAEGDELQARSGDAAEQRAAGEQDQAGGEHLPPAEDVSQRSGGQ